MSKSDVENIVTLKTSEEDRSQTDYVCVELKPVCCALSSIGVMSLHLLVSDDPVTNL